jgi:hypothetical protein
LLTGESSYEVARVVNEVEKVVRADVFYFLDTEGVGPRCRLDALSGLVSLLLSKLVSTN